MSSNFPNADSLCEACGYPLQGLSCDTSCPECGESVVSSDPIHRVGLPWQQRMSLVTFFGTCWAILREPRSAIRKMQIGTTGGSGGAGDSGGGASGGGGANWRERFFLLINLCVIGLWWAVRWKMAHRPDALRWALTMSLLALALVYIEILGVAYFSWRKHWRVPLRTAERVCCYASIGLLPAAAVWAELTLFYFKKWPGRWTLDDWLMVVQANGHLLYIYGIPTLMFVGLTLMGFESLAGLGARQVKFGNFYEK